MSYLARNNAYSTLASPINNTATSITVATGHGDRFPVIVSPDYTYVALDNGLGAIEIVKVTARAAASDTMTVVRAQEGTTAISHGAGVAVELRMTAGLVEDAMGHFADTTAAHAASAIGFTPTGNVASTNVQAAIAELDTEKQPVDATLTALAAVVTAANKLIYAIAADTFATTDLTAAGRALLDDADAAAQRSTLGLGALSVLSQVTLAELDSSVNATQAEAEAGVENTKFMTALRVAQAIVGAVRTYTKAQRGAVVSLTDAATVALDLSAANNFSLLLTSGVGATRQLGNPTNAVAGQSGVLVVTQDATGSRAISYGSNYKFAGGSAPALSTAANAVDYLSYYVESATRIFISANRDIK